MTSNNNTVKSIKIRFGDEIRKISTNYFIPNSIEGETTPNTSRLNWDDFVSKVFTLFGKDVVPTAKFQYTDSEGDKVTISSNFELAESLRTPNVTTLLIEVIDNNHQPNKLAEAINPEAQRHPAATMFGRCGRHHGATSRPFSVPLPAFRCPVFQQIRQDPILNELFRKVSNNGETVPEGRGFTREGQLAVQVSSWFKGEDRSAAVLQFLKDNLSPCLEKLKPIFAQKMKMLAARSHFARGGGGCLVNREVSSLLSVLEKQKSDEDKEIICQLCEVYCCCAMEAFPTNANLRYNTACLYSLWNKLDKAVHFLTLALDLGFNNITCLLQDEDLQPLREVPEFQQLVASALEKPHSREQEVPHLPTDIPTPSISQTPLNLSNMFATIFQQPQESPTLVLSSMAGALNNLFGALHQPFDEQPEASTAESASRQQQQPQPQTATYQTTIRTAVNQQTPSQQIPPTVVPPPPSPSSKPEEPKYQTTLSATVPEKKSVTIAPTVVEPQSVVDVDEEEFEEVIIEEALDEIADTTVVPADNIAATVKTADTQYDEETMVRIQQLWGMGFQLTKEEAVELLKKNNNSVGRIVNTMFE